jgi:Flp pilus assembly protein TadD
MESAVETARLRQEIERALRCAFDPADVLPRLARLARLAPPASDDGIYAHRQLAELLVERHPWRAALYARRALVHRRDDDRAWAVLAFCQTLLGNFRAAASAYRHAIACAPANPWYAHNLGHLLDVALGEPRAALRWLRTAYDAKGDNSEIVASYTHALARAGELRLAREVLERALDRFESRELSALLRWLDQGAPSRTDRRARAKAKLERPAKSTKPPRETTPKRLARVLTRGLAHLPLDTQQRERALAIARDVLPPPSGSRRRDDVAGLAAAVAYAIVFVDHLPLSQAEVAAPFRVGVGRLRGRFAELRAQLDLIRGDARYATTRR